MRDRLILTLLTLATLAAGWYLGVNWPVEPLYLPEPTPGQYYPVSAAWYERRADFDLALSLAYERELAKVKPAMPIAAWLDLRRHAVESALPVGRGMPRDDHGRCDFGPSDELHLQVFGGTAPKLATKLFADEDWESDFMRKPVVWIDKQQVQFAPTNLRGKHEALAALAVAEGTSCNRGTVSDPLAVEFYVGVSPSGEVAVWGPSEFVTWVQPTAKGRPDQEEVLRVLLAQVPMTMPWQATLYLSPNNAAAELWGFLRVLREEVHKRLPTVVASKEDPYRTAQLRPGVQLTGRLQFPSGMSWQ